MENQLNQVQQEILDILYNNGSPAEKSLQGVLNYKDANGIQPLHDFKGSEILYAKKNLAKMGLIEVIEAQRRHDLEEGDGFTRVGDDVTFYYYDLDKKLKITAEGVKWCKMHFAQH
ncbi:hypothetical protein [Mangrovibacterium lignilyticum]|uniref:hypothetical protein n=1 Tax=Mangrovibacterium lignilyticum TaxID=2668052 RepID=UPI0013CF5367|nr:hypothetical protein [Mangrovibacterium lignilyticum]